MQPQESENQKDILSKLSDAELLEIVQSVDFKGMRESRDKGFNTVEVLGNALLHFITEIKSHPTQFGVGENFTQWDPKRILGLFSGSGEIERFLARQLGIAETHIADVDFGSYKQSLVRDGVGTTEKNVFEALLLGELPNQNDLIVCSGVDFLFSPTINDLVVHKGLHVQRTAVAREIMARKLPAVLSDKSMVICWFEGGADLLAGDPSFSEIPLGMNAIYCRDK